MSTDRQYFDDPAPIAPHLDADEVPGDDLWPGEDMPPDDDTPDDTDDIGPGDDLIAPFDVSSDDARKELFTSGMFQDWLKSVLKQAGVKPVAETAPTVQGYNGISPAALRLAQKAAALWEKEYP